MQLYWIWATIGLILLIVEVFLGTHFFLFFLSAAILITSGLGAFFSLSGEAMLWIFSVLSVALMLIWHQMFRLSHRGHDVNNPLLALKGLVGIVVQGDDSQMMKIKVGHTLWSARSADNKAYAKDTRVTVVGIDSLRLIIKEINTD